jgi:hypothetical protein
MVLIEYPDSATVRGKNLAQLNLVLKYVLPSNDTFTRFSADLTPVA